MMMTPKTMLWILASAVCILLVAPSNGKRAPKPRKCKMDECKEAPLPLRFHGLMENFRTKETFLAWVFLDSQEVSLMPVEQTPPATFTFIKYGHFGNGSSLFITGNEAGSCSLSAVAGHRLPNKLPTGDFNDIRMGPPWLCHSLKHDFTFNAAYDPATRACRLTDFEFKGDQKVIAYKSTAIRPMPPPDPRHPSVDIFAQTLDVCKGLVLPPQ